MGDDSLFKGLRETLPDTATPVFAHHRCRHPGGLVVKAYALLGNPFVNGNGLRVDKIRGRKHGVPFTAHHSEIDHQGAHRTKRAFEFDPFG
jgi:hypothetical protein